MKRLLPLAAMVVMSGYCEDGGKAPQEGKAGGALPPKAAYVVIDLSGGPDAADYPVTELKTPPSGGWTDEYKTFKMVLRRIPAGTFMMGSPPDEQGRENETLHQVTLTQDFYIGVFQVTQKQYGLVMGNNPSEHKGDVRPVECVSYDMLRGTGAGARWPVGNNSDARSFFGRLRSRTSLIADLPTEAQWEYACRAGTSTTLNSGKDLTHAEKCPNMAEVGRYGYNQSDGKGGYSSAHTKVGMYHPNQWGLYDMHGNVWEWCLDWYTDDLGTASVTDPKGASSGSGRLLRGGSCNLNANRCRSACRGTCYKVKVGYDFIAGFRACLLPVAVQ